MRISDWSSDVCSSDLTNEVSSSFDVVSERLASHLHVRSTSKEKHIAKRFINPERSEGAAIAPHYQQRRQNDGGQQVNASPHAIGYSASVLSSSGPFASFSASASPSPSASLSYSSRS